MIYHIFNFIFSLVNFLCWIFYYFKIFFSMIMRSIWILASIGIYSMTLFPINSITLRNNISLLLIFSRNNFLTKTIFFQITTTMILFFNNFSFLNELFIPSFWHGSWLLISYLNITTNLIILCNFLLLNINMITIILD